jgi:UDP-N-acetylmuramoyl-L-alanyl-D-glutamate--2,6-diaminopimelate ligase
MLNKLKKYLPASILDRYHLVLAHIAAWRYGCPSEKIIVIGVTGTNGKSTTCNFIAHILEEAGHKVGMTTTVNFRIAGKEWLNPYKMTMLGRFRLQKMLADMVRAGCRYAVIETSSEGIKQHRHAAVNYDVAVFTNLTPEHLESHGGFENYKAAKGRLFAKLAREKVKKMANFNIRKTAVINLNDQHAGYFLSFPVPVKVGFSVGGKPTAAVEGLANTVIAKDVQLSTKGSVFTVDGEPFSMQLPGAFNVENALAAIAVGRVLGLAFEVIARALAKVEVVPGRMEFISAGQSFSVLVDYAPEPESFRKLYEAVALFPKKRVIHVLGSCGGGRDVDRRPVLGRLAAQNADIVIVTNEDPYDDDPGQIIQEVAAGATGAGKVLDKDLFLIQDREAALNKAVALAEPGDMVIATGKGAEQAIVTAGGVKLPWDERTKLLEAIRRRYPRN